MNVYVVCWGHWDDSEVVAVYVSLDAVSQKYPRHEWSAEGTDQEGRRWWTIAEHYDCTECELQE